MAATQVTATLAEMTSGSPRSANLETTVQFNELAARVNHMMAHYYANQVFPGTLAGISVDANAEDIETDNTIFVSILGCTYKIAATAAIDISALSAGGATIATSKYGVAWVFVGADGTVDVEVAVNASTDTSPVQSFGAWATATNTLPPLGAAQVCIGAVLVQEGGSGTFTWGTDSITGETETYLDFVGRPSVQVATASFAADVGAATINYGAGKIALGDGSHVSYTGKASGETVTGSNVAVGDTGAWLFYVIADDVETSIQLGAAYADPATALLAVQNHNPNPYLPLVGYFTVENNSAAVWIPGTTAFNASGITATFYRVGPTNLQKELGRNTVAGSPYTAVGQVVEANGTVIA